MARRLRLRPASRLRRNADFLEVRNQGKPYRCPYFMLFSRIRVGDSTDVLRPRIGISASRRVGNAVVRNKIKRRFREVFRTNQYLIRTDADIVLSLRSPAARATFEELEQRFLHALKFKRLLLRDPRPTEEEAGAD